MRIYLKLLLVEAALVMGRPPRCYLLLGMVRPCSHILAQQVMRVSGPLMQDALATNTHMVTYHGSSCSRHVLSLHRGGHSGAPLLHRYDLFPLLYLYLLIDRSHAWLYLIIVVLDVQGLACLATELHILRVLLDHTLHHAISIIHMIISIAISRFQELFLISGTVLLCPP